MENITSQPGFISSASDGSTFNSADGDSGAQDMFGDSLSLGELRKAYPELYRFMCRTDLSFEETEISEAKEEESISWPKMGTKSAKERDFEGGADVAQLLKESNSPASLLTIRKAMSSIFECLNTVHVQKTLKLRLEIRDLCCRLQSLQTSREMDQREIYRLQRENDRYCRELAQQAALYEDRITELHGVLEELKRKLAASAAEMQTSNTNATVAVDDLVEVSDSDGENEGIEFSATESGTHDDRSELLARQEAGPEAAWMSGSARTVGSVQSDTTAAVAGTTGGRHSASGIISDSRSQGKPVMGVRQHNQTRKPRILSQAQLGVSPSTAGGSNWLRRNSAQFSQPNSEFSLNYDASEQAEGMSKASSNFEERVRQAHSGALSDSTNSVPQSCRSAGDNNAIDVASIDESEPQWVRLCVNRCLGASGSGAASPSPTAAQALLSGLTSAAPYQRLADVAHYALLACEQREALCARQEAELTVLEAALADAKTTSNQLQCRLGHVESSWGAATRAAELADMALEASGVLVHLYASELALLLHKQPGNEGRSSKSDKSHRGRNFVRLSSAFSGSSSSTSSTTNSSSSSCSSSEDEDHMGSPRPRKNNPPPTTATVPSRQHLVSNLNHHVANQNGKQPHPAASMAPSESGSNLYAVYAPSGKPEEAPHNLSVPNWIAPHAICNGAACMRLLKMQRHQTEVAALHLLARFGSAQEPFLKPESLISGHPDDSDPGATNGNRSTATGTESGLGAESGGSSSGMGPQGVYANAWSISTRPGLPAQRHPFKSYGAGGWQTPDSGAGSFSINDHSNSVGPTGPVVSPAGGAAVSTSHTCTSRSSTHSSNSSGNMNSSAGIPGAAAMAQSDGAGWTRMKEMKLRHILDQIIWERMLVRNSIVVVGGADFENVCTGANQGGDFQYMKPYAGSEPPTYSEHGNVGQATRESRDPIITNRLNSLFMVDTASLLQELCAVKEDRAKLKVQNYIMEKELRAIQLSHQGHCLSESALRSQLNTLQVDRNLQMLKISDRSGGQNPLTQQIESLQVAFESLRKSAEQHQSQSEELVNDLKQANAALITAFEKAKSKYLARIRKLESQIAPPNPSTPLVLRTGSSIPSSRADPKPSVPVSRPPVVPAHRTAPPPPQLPLPPVSPPPASDVYEVIQDSQVTNWQGQEEPVNITNPNGCYSIVRTAPYYPKHPMAMMMGNRPPTRPR